MYSEMKKNIENSAIAISSAVTLMPLIVRMPEDARERDQRRLRAQLDDHEG